MTDRQTVHMDAQLGVVYLPTSGPRDRVVWFGAVGYSAAELPSLIAFLQDALRDSSERAANTTNPNGGEPQ